MPKQSELNSIEDLNPDLYNLMETIPLGILSFYTDGKISFVNRNFLRFGIAKNNIGKILDSNVFTDEIFPGVELKNELDEIKRGIPFEKIVTQVKTLDGGEISIIIKGAPNFSEGNFAGGVLIIEDIKITLSDGAHQILKVETFGDFFNSICEALLIIDPDGILRYLYGGKTRHILDYNEDPSGSSVSDLLDLKSRREFTEALDKLKSGALSAQFSVTLRRYPEITYSAIAAPFIENKKNIRFIFVQLTDQTERMTEVERLNSEILELKQFQSITEAVTGPLIMIEKDGKVRFWNRAAQELFGFTRSEVYGKSITKVYKGFDKEQLIKIKEELIQHGFWKSVISVYKKDGRKEIAEVAFSTVNGNIENILAMFTDITERTEIEKTLRSSEEMFRNIISFSGESVCCLEPDGTITYVNPAFCKIMEKNEDEVIGLKLFDLIEIGFIKKNKYGFDEFLKKFNNAFEFPFFTKTGKQYFLQAEIYPVNGIDNSVKYFCAVFTDITGRKEDEKRFLIVKSIFSASQNALSVIVERKILLANEAFVSIFGYNGLNEILGKDPLDFVAEADMARVAEFIKARENRKEAPPRYEFLGKKRDNSNFLLETLSTSFEIDGEVYIINEAHDITERKRAQQAIRDSEEKYRSITENIDDFMWTAERIDGRLKGVFYTTSVEKIMGYTQADFIKDPKLFLKIIMPDDFSFVKKKFRNIINSTIRNSEELEFRIINKQGNVVWIRNKIKLIRTQDKSVQKIFGLVSDISLRKKAEEELKKSTEELVKLNETKDRFISIISHDLRTPFTSILGFTDLLLSDKDLSENEKIQYVKFIQESAQSMFALVNSLLDWTRLQTGRMKFEPEKIEAKNVIDKSLRSLSGAAIQKGITLVDNVDEDVVIFADSNLLMQVFNNIISNSIKFTGGGGQISVSAVPFVLNRNYEFTISDTGIGIKKENLSKLFNVDTKFTTEGTAGEKGSGLGLSLCKEIVEKHNGKIWVESEYGSGSHFKFTLPIASSNILYVEDSKTDRLLYSKIIKNIAEEYDVIVAKDGEEGFEKLKSAQPALLITDHIMPGMNGYEMVKKMLASNLSNKPPVIVLSADVDRNITEDYYYLGIEYVFRKPVNLISFKMAVEKSLKKGLRIK